MDRLQRYYSISQKIKKFSNAEIQKLLLTAKPLHVGIDGKTFELSLDFQNIFVKKIPLSELEMRSENWLSTANLYQLPLFCQYGLGAPGFGSWRELFSNQQTTQWILEKSSESFSALYHWCILPAENSDSPSNEELEKTEAHIDFWENSDSVRRRYQAIQNPQGEIVLFSEFIPVTLIDWIKTQHSNAGSFEMALDFVDQKLLKTIEFMQSQNFLHFDAHFENIMTDGKNLYFNDLGLSLSKKFSLQKEEVDFFQAHKNYDCARSAVGFMHAIIVSACGSDNWKLKLREEVQSEKSSLSEKVRFYIQKYGPLALLMLEFSEKLKTESKTTPFPLNEVERLIDKNKIY